MKSKQNWERSDDFEMMFEGEYTTGYYKILHQKIHKEFRSLQIIKEPFKRMSSLWKLPFYLAGWFWNSVKLKKSEHVEKSNKNILKLKEAVS